MTEAVQPAPTRDVMMEDVLGILKEKVQALDIDYSDKISGETRVVGDLEFESVNIVEFCMAIGKHYKKKFPFQELVFKDGQFRDFTVSDLVAFLESSIGK
jgi:acyl carrier protein